MIEESALAAAAAAATSATLASEASLATLALDDNFRSRRTHASYDLSFGLLAERAATREFIHRAGSSRARLSLLFGHVLHLLGEALLLGLDHGGWVSDVFSLVEVLVPPAEALHHVSAFVGAASLVDQLRVLPLTTLLKSQMRPLLPLLVDAVLVLHHDALLADLFTSFVLSLLYDLTLPVDLLERVALLDLVPLHHGLALGVHVLIIRHQVQRHVIKESCLVVVPER